MHTENWAQITRTVISLDSRNLLRQTERKDRDANLSLQKKYPEYREIQMQSTDFSLLCI